MSNNQVLHEGVKLFLEHIDKQKSLSINTINAYRNDLTDLIRYCNLNKHIFFDDFDLSMYIEHLLKIKLLQHSSVKRKIITLKIFFKFCKEKYFIEHSPFENCNVKLKIPLKLPRPVSENELAKLMTHWKDRLEITSIETKSSNITSWLSISIMLATGIRVSELTYLKLNDVSSDGKIIRIFGKGSKERTVYITNKYLSEFLSIYRSIRLKESSNNSLLLINRNNKPLKSQTIRKRLRKLGETYNFDRNFTPHRLRHTAATRLMDKGMDIRFVQKLLGHSSIKTTEIYTNVTDKSLYNALNQAKHMEDIM